MLTHIQIPDESCAENSEEILLKCHFPGSVEPPAANYANVI